MSKYSGTRVKLSIGSLELEANDLVVVAQYNPKELPVAKAVSWHGDQPMAPEYAGAQGRELTIELLFDGYETKQSVLRQLLVLDELSSPRKPDSPIEAERRPHRCVVAWGDKMERFRCVITSFESKFVMWNDDGLPVRAVATVKLKEIDTDAMAKAEAERARRYAAQPGMRRVS